MKQKRTRRWVFTLNNPKGNLDDFIKQLTERVAVRYVVVGRETAPTTGTLHWQGFVEFNNPATFNQVKDRLYGAHVEPAKGSNSQNRDYCTKSGDFVEHGQLFTRVQTSEQAHEVIKLIAEGLAPTEIALLHPALTAYIVNHYRPLRDIYYDFKYLDEVKAKWATLRGSAAAPEQVQGCEHGAEQLKETTPPASEAVER